MTKLMEWLSVLGVIIAIWYALLTQKISNNFDETLVLLSPVILVGLFGLYAATVVLYRTCTFNDCDSAASELRSEILEARADLKKLGFVFKTEKS